MIKSTRKQSTDITAHPPPPLALHRSADRRPTTSSSPATAGLVRRQLRCSLCTCFRCATEELAASMPWIGAGTPRLRSGWHVAFGHRRRRPSIHRLSSRWHVVGGRCHAGQRRALLGQQHSTAASTDRLESAPGQKGSAGTATSQDCTWRATDYRSNDVLCSAW